MRVVAIVPAYPPRSRVGAWLATHELLADLARHGHPVSAYTTLAKDPPYDIDGVHVERAVSGPALNTAVARCDVIVSHAGDTTGRPSALAARWSKPNVRMVHGAVRDQASIEGAAMLVFNSHSLRSTCGSPPGSIVVHPPVFPDRHATVPGDRVTLVNLSYPKGGSLFWRLARYLEDVEFLGVRGGYGNQLHDHRLRNVDTMATATDMRSVWSRTRVLLMPSVAETWGMVGVEAFASGIPVIAHPTPGLLESLGPAGIFVDRDEPSGWVDEIRRLQDPEEWAAASARALARSAQLDPHVSLAAFRAALDTLITTGAAPTCEPSYSSHSAPMAAAAISCSPG